MNDSSRNAPAVKLAAGKAPHDSRPQVGAQVGRHRLVRPIGGGATGRVFEVEHLDGGHRAVMRVISAEDAAGPGALRQLLGEARAAAQLDHPHIAGISEVIEAGQAGGTSAIVMELVDGHSLTARVAEEGPLPLDRLVPILAQVIDAIGAAHAVNIVHRDLNPERILLTNRAGTSDYVVIVGFGLAGSVARLPAYAAPAGEVDGRADIYSFGVILYELLCGRLPFEATGNHAGPGAPPAAPKRVLSTPTGRTLDAVARRCLRADPAHRWQSAGAIKRILEALLCEEEVDLSEPPGDVLAGGEGDGERTAVPSGDDDFLDQLEPPHGKGRWIAAAALAVLVLGGGGFLVTRKRGTPPAAAIAAVTPEQPPVAAAPPSPRPAPSPPPAAPSAPVAAAPSPPPAPVEVPPVAAPSAPVAAAPSPPPAPVEVPPVAAPSAPVAAAAASASTAKSTPAQEVPPPPADVPSPAGAHPKAEVARSDARPSTKAIHHRTEKAAALPAPAPRKPARAPVGHEGTVNPFGN
jgi:eukaryotic-like serine/threonine-protein kinase